MKTEDIKKMAQAWKEVQEASYGKKKMEASDTQMGTITVKTDAERKARAQAYRDKKAATNEAMDPVNPKELKGKHKDRKDKDINNDGKVDSTDKYLHARRKAVSAAIKGKKKDTEVEVQTSEAVEQIDENKALLKHYQDLKSQGKKDHHALDYLMSMPKFKNMTRDHMAKTIGDAKRKGIFKEAAKINEISKKTLGSYINKAHKDYDKQRTKQGAAYDKAARTGSDDDEDKGHEYGRKADKRTQGIKTAVSKLTREARDHGNMNNGSPAGEGLSPSAKKELARKTPMPDFVNEPKVDKKTFDAIRASGKKAPARNGDNTAGDKNVINKPMDITAKAPKKEDDGFKDS